MEPRQAEKLSNPGQLAPQSGQQEPWLSSGDRNVEERIHKIKDAMADKGINLTAEDIEGLRSYLTTKRHWEEVYRRLADS